MTRASSSKVRPIVNPAPAVFSNSSGVLSVSFSAALTALPSFLNVGAGRLSLAAARMDDHPVSADPVPDRQRMGERGERLPAHLGGRHLRR